jgi:hypothetical protein
MWSGGGAWRDALKFEHGDSGDSSATNWPRVHLGSNVALTGLRHNGRWYDLGQCRGAADHQPDEP